MADKRAIDKLKEAFCIDNRSRYIIKKEDVVILEIYWKPLTIADREAIYKTLAGMNKANDTESLEYALQVIMNKAEDENGNKLFSEGDRASLRREIPLTVLTDLMLKMQGVEEEVDTVNSKSTS
jgi:diphthamide biosynthesis methyltransferase|tara:strand:+ start:299 stop:670 length:372 start_codon:yes stop_codon:yes gene_type:complete